MSPNQSPAQRVVETFRNDPALQDRLKSGEDPAAVVQDAATKVESETSWQKDKWVFRIALLVLGVLALSAAVGSIWMTLMDKTTPESLVAIGSTAVGALVGLFARKSSSD